MRRTFSFLAIGLCALIAQPVASASGRNLSIDADMSAAKKKKQQYVYVRRAPQAGYVRGPWMDPSFGPDGRPYPNPYPPNECSTDLGYGRFSGCNNRN